MELLQSRMAQKVEKIEKNELKKLFQRLFASKDQPAANPAICLTERAQRQLSLRTFHITKVLSDSTKASRRLWGATIRMVRRKWRHLRHPAGSPFPSLPS